MKYATVTVTYNRKEELAKNLQAVLNQTIQPDCCYVIDNHSTDGTEEYLNKVGLLPNQRINYVYLPKNMGGAGGFYYGSKLAHKRGYDYIVLMDDDGRPRNNQTFEIMLEHAERVHERKRLIFLNSLVTNEDDKLSFGLGTYTDVSQVRRGVPSGTLPNLVNPFNGTLISKELFDCIGYPNKDFFIKGDEHDFMCRAMKAKAYVATTTNALYLHPSLPKYTVRILGKKQDLIVESAWKEYYRTRNYTYIYSRDHAKKQLRNMIKMHFLGNLLFGKTKIKTFRMMIKGYLDGRSGKMGIRVLP